MALSLIVTVTVKVAGDPVTSAPERVNTPAPAAELIPCGSVVTAEDATRGPLPASFGWLTGEESPVKFKFVTIVSERGAIP